MRIDEQDMDVDRCWDNNLDDDSTWCGQSLHTSDRAPYNLRIKSERTDFEHLANSQQYLATRSKTQERVSFRPTWKAGPCSERDQHPHLPLCRGQKLFEITEMRILPFWKSCHSNLSNHKWLSTDFFAMGTWVKYKCLLWMSKTLTLSLFPTDSSYFPKPIP